MNDKKWYAAPLEGVTTYIFRKAHHAIYPGVDKYFTPFISPNKNKGFSHRDRMELLAEHNENLSVVPQILTNVAEDFIKAAREIHQMGYSEVNLNLGCPSGTVVSKKKGAGFLAYPEQLERFLHQIFLELDMDISIKTRIGKTDPDEFEELLAIFNRFPLKELIVHPRIQLDFYKNEPNWPIFEFAACHSKCPVCYNGNIFTSADYLKFHRQFPEIKNIMLGRGLIARPDLVQVLNMAQGCDRGANGEENESIEVLDMKKFRMFHDRIYEDYQGILSGDRNVLFRMKELWQYWIWNFPECKKLEKRIKKSERLKDYELAISELFS